MNKKNAEGYDDPTAYEALTNVFTAEKAKRALLREPPPERPPRHKRRNNRVYICSPYRGDVERNIQSAISYCRYAVGQGKMPIAPHIWLPLFLNDEDRKQRETALDFGVWLISQCREVWVFGETVSEGMKTELAEAKRLRISIRRFTDKESTQIIKNGGTDHDIN